MNINADHQVLLPAIRFCIHTLKTSWLTQRLSQHLTTTPPTVIDSSNFSFFIIVWKTTSPKFPSSHTQIQGFPSVFWLFFLFDSNLFGVWQELLLFRIYFPFLESIFSFWNPFFNFWNPFLIFWNSLFLKFHRASRFLQELVFTSNHVVL